MKVYRPPVGLMFYEGAPRLLRSPASIIPFDPPTMTALSSRPIRPWWPKPSSQRRSTRRRTLGRLRRSLGVCGSGFVRELPDGVIPRRYGVNVVVADDVARACIDDSEGDSLDAVLAAVQAAWAWDRRHDGYGVPEDCDLLEGWIVDPVTKPSVNSSITRVRPVFQDC